MFGISGSANMPLGKLPIGVTAGAGFELLWSPWTQNSALYTYVGGGVTLFAPTKSASLQASAGLVFRSSDSSSYCGAFNTVTIPYTSLPKAAQEGINRRITYMASSALISVGKDSVVNTAFSLGIPTQGVLNKTSINIFWSPDSGGSCGFSFSYTLGETQGSVSRASYTRSHYWQVAPMTDCFSHHPQQIRIA